MSQALEQAGTEPDAPVEGAPDAEAPKHDWQEVARTWLTAIEYAQSQRKDFLKRGRRISQRYRAALDRNDAARAGSKFNIFWSNVQTLAPATYSRRPKVEVTRRFRDSDPVGRLAGLILERALQYEVDKGLSFHLTLQNCVLDRLLPGLGVAWVRYEPSFRKETQEVPVEGSLELESTEVEVIADEFTPIDYVYWEHFLTSPAQTWADVTWVGRQVPFTKEALKKRFGETIVKFGGNIDEVPVNHDPLPAAKGDTDTKEKSEEVDPSLKRALVWELWDKSGKQVIFVSKGCQVPLDIVDDVALLDEFFPCPKPLLATTTNDEQTPVADFIIYQDQARELDDITNRISLLVKALRLVGVYDASQDSLKNLLQSGLENRMVPVNAWAAFAEKGGLKGVTDFLPLEQVVMVLEGLYKAREATKQVIYEITGMADIIRGASVASETLGAQEIKAKFANLRLNARQQQVAEFVTMILQIKAQLMCNHYTPETLVRISSAELLTEVQQHPDRLQGALKLLADDRARSYRIEVQAESMLELDEVDEQKRRNEFMSTVSNFFLAAKNIGESAPEMMPVSLEMLKFALRGFPIARSLESALEDAAEAIQKRLAQPQKPQPSPEQIKAELVKFQEEQENMRLRIKEDGATDREELKASVQLALAGMEDRLERLLTMVEMLDRQSDRDQLADQRAMTPSAGAPT